MLLASFLDWVTSLNGLLEIGGYALALFVLTRILNQSWNTSQRRKRKHYHVDGFEPPPDEPETEYRIEDGDG